MLLDHMRITGTMPVPDQSRVVKTYASRAATFSLGLQNHTNRANSVLRCTDELKGVCSDVERGV